MIPQRDCIYFCDNCGHEVLKSDEQCPGCNTIVEWNKFTDQFISKDEFDDTVNELTKYVKEKCITKDELRDYLKQELLNDNTKSLKVAVAQGSLIGGIMNHFDL